MDDDIFSDLFSGTSFFGNISDTTPSSGFGSGYLFDQIHNPINSWNPINIFHTDD